MFEKENTINDFIENLRHKVFDVLKTRISDNDFDNFWKYFIDKKEDIFPNFILYVVPCYDRASSNPFQIYTEKNTLSSNNSYLSEFIASHDNIYKNMIFMPFASICDTEFNKTINEAPSEEKDFMKDPDKNLLYSPLRKALDNYLGDSQGIFYLDLYKITINDNIIDKVFYKNIEILYSKDKKPKKNLSTKLTFNYVDCLGIEFKEPKFIDLYDNEYDIKLYNLFYKGNVPFNYNMNSNNGWLEMFVDTHLDFDPKTDLTKFNNFIQITKDSKYYEEFNFPQTDIETKYKNYKIKCLTIETNYFPSLIRCDDYMDLEQKQILEKMGVSKDNDKNLFKIKIEPFLIKGEKYSIPVATFTTI